MQPSELYVCPPPRTHPQQCLQQPQRAHLHHDFLHRWSAACFNIAVRCAVRQIRKWIRHGLRLFAFLFGRVSAIASVK